MGFYVEDLDALDFRTPTFHGFCTEKIGLPVTMTKLEVDIASGKLRPVRIGRNWHYSRRMALEWAESFGMSIDWERAKAEAKRERAQLALKEADAELAELSFAAMNDLQAWDSGPYRSITHGRKILMISATPNRRN